MSRLVSLVAATIARAVAEMPKPPAKVGAVREGFDDYEPLFLEGDIIKILPLYVDPGPSASFKRMLRLKHSFLPTLFQTGKERVFK